MCLNLSCCLPKPLKLTKDSPGGAYSGDDSSQSLVSVNRFTGTRPCLSVEDHGLRLFLQYSRNRDAV